MLLPVPFPEILLRPGLLSQPSILIPGAIALILFLISSYVGVRLMLRGLLKSALFFSN